MQITTDTTTITLFNILICRCKSALSNFAQAADCKSAIFNELIKTSGKIFSKLAGGMVIKNIAISEGGLGLNSWADQISGVMLQR